MSATIKVWVGIIVFLVIVVIFANITGSDSASQTLVENSTLGFNWWILFPFGIAILMLYIIFFTKPKALSLGAVLILIGTIGFFWFNYNWFVPGLNVVNEKLGQPAISAITPSTNDEQSVAPKTHVQAVIDESEWENLGVATCDLGWKTKTSKEGWCKLRTDIYPTGQYPAGKYRFKTMNSLLTKISAKDTNERVSIPPEGFPLNTFSSKMIAYVRQYSPLPQEGVWRLLIRISGEENPTPTTSIVNARENDSFYLTVNMWNTQSNWEILDLKGRITMKILKKKT